VSVTLPLFFWMKQNEDIESAHHDLAAARDNFESVRIQTQAAVTQAYRTTQLAYETALVYRDSLIRLARQNFEVALVGYQSAKIDFVTLSAALANAYGARIAYLRAANEYLAGRVALERAIGEPLAQ
jgi:cobalt-zinc-cadmium efflux system outer membrane protein